MADRRAQAILIAGVVFVGLLSVEASFAQTAAEQSVEPLRYETVIQGGRVMDPETGLDATRYVGIRDGMIEALSEQPIEGEVMLDASGLVVAPGFIDLDSYADLARFQVADGVTSMFEIRHGTADVDDWYEAHGGKMPIHFGVGVGFRPVRHQVMEPTRPEEMDVAATEEELTEILSRVKAGLEHGAVAIGMGPGRHPYLYWELLRTLQLAAVHGVPVVAPMRDAIWAETDVPANLSELIGAAYLTGASLHLPYLTSSGGPHTPRLLELVSMARDRGLDITVEDLPYRGAVTVVDDLDWMSEEELSDIFLISENRTLEPKDVEALRNQRNTVVILNSHLEPFVAQSVSSPLTSIASHGYLDENLRGHPRTSGTYSRVLGKYVREEGRLTLMDALRKMSLMPAQRLEKRVPAMRKKGRVQVGADADLVLFDEGRVIDRATYHEPTLPSRGIDYVLVKGVVVVEGGALQTDLYPGEAIRAPTGSFRELDGDQ